MAYLLLNFEFFLTFLSFLSLCSLLLLLVAIVPRALVDEHFGAIAAAFTRCALSVGQIVAPFAFVFGPVKHTLDVLRVVGTEDGDRAAPNTRACALAKPVQVSFVVAAVSQFGT